MDKDSARHLARLHSRNHLCRCVPQDREAYDHIRKHKDEYAAYMREGGEALEVNEDLKTVSWRSLFPDGTEKLTATQTVFLLILQIAWLEYGRRESSAPDQPVETEISDIRDRLADFYGNPDYRVSNAKIDETFARFERHGLVRKKGAKYSDPASRIFILPSIMLKLEEETLNDLIQHLERIADDYKPDTQRP